MKKISILLLAVLALFAITACDNSTEKPETVNVPSWADGTYDVKMNGMLPAGTLKIGSGSFTMTVTLLDPPMQVSSTNITNITEQNDYVNAENQKEYKLAGTLSLTISGQEPTAGPASFVFTKISETELTLSADLGGGSVMSFTCEMQ